MSSYKDHDFQQRQTNASTAKKAMLEKFRTASEDPSVAERAVSVRMKAAFA